MTSTAHVDANGQEILRRLREGWEALLDAVRGIDESLARQRPQPEGWSVLDCVEHITATELFLLSRLREATPEAESCEDRPREAKLAGLALNRNRRIEAPQQVCPKGTWQSLAQAVDGFAAVRADTVRFVEEFPGDLHSWRVIHPLITRPLNCYEMLLLMALHPKRHALQIVEIRRMLAR